MLHPLVVVVAVNPYLEQPRAQPFQLLNVNPYLDCGHNSAGVDPVVRAESSRANYLMRAQ